MQQKTFDFTTGMKLGARCSRNAATMARIESLGTRMESLGMNEAQTGASSALFGSWRHTSVSRGLGLTNKMRTYQLQDYGLDIFDANTTLGFDDDERDHGVAAHMLRTLNCTRI